MNQLEAAIEAVLFAAGDAVEISRLSAALGQEQSLVELALQRMADAYDFEQRGIMLIHIDSKVQLCRRRCFYMATVIGNMHLCKSRTIMWRLDDMGTKKILFANG